MAPQGLRQSAALAAFDIPPQHGYIRHVEVLRMTSTVDSVLEEVRAWLDQGRNVALATVVSTWGSAPRPVGSQLAIDQDGNFIGSVSGGCVEGAVVTEAMEVLSTGRPTMLEFGVSNETAWEVGLACGGTIRVYVERLGDEDRDA